MNNTARQILAAPLGALIMTAALLSALASTETTSAPSPSYLSEARAIVQAETAREAAGAKCEEPKALAARGIIPSRVLVSERNADLIATSVESMTFDQAWAAAKAGRVAIRCAIA